MKPIRFKLIKAPKDDGQIIPGLTAGFGYCWWFWLPEFFHWSPRTTSRGWTNCRNFRIAWLNRLLDIELGYEGPTK